MKQCHAYEDVPPETFRLISQVGCLYPGRRALPVFRYAVNALSCSLGEQPIEPYGRCPTMAL